MLDLTWLIFLIMKWCLHFHPFQVNEMEMNWMVGKKVEGLHQM